MKTPKIEFQPELNDPPRRGREDLPEAARFPGDVGRPEVRMVERVEELRAELDVAPRVDGEILRQREVEVGHPWAAHDADAGVAECLRRRAERRERVGIEPAVQRA